MERPAAAHELGAHDRLDRAPRKARLEHAECRIVGAREKHRHRHEAVADDVVQVARRQLRPLEGKPRRDIERNHLEPPAPGVDEAPQPLEIGLERGMVGIERVGLPSGHHPAGRHEPGQLVDVAVGVVAGEFASHPEHLPDPQTVAEDRFQLQPRHSRVSRRVFDAAVVHEERIFAVGLEAAPFEHEPAVDHGEPESLSDRPAERRVEIPWWIFFTPRIPAPDHGGGLRARRGLARHDEHRPRVSEPRIVRGEIDELDVRNAVEPCAGVGKHCARGHDPHRLVAGDDTCHPLEHARNHGEVAQPRGLAVGPGKPRGRVRLPLGRQAVVWRDRGHHAPPQRWSSPP